MVVPEGTLSQPSNVNSDGEEDDVSTSSENDQNYDGAVVLHDDRQQLPALGNISVMNSSDVHFGNKTFYQGPVTIKQFLYANGKTQQDKTDCDSEIVLDAATIPNGLDNPIFIPDFPTSKAASNKPVTEENISGVLKGITQEDRQFGIPNILIFVTAEGISQRIIST
ncbi:hypothetical protein BDFB_007349 [Asbolus verrucosus]|uniref:Uncharacterized protein n=1 Tax=Asbolus verrucosus TaxID=1661398 RepID=A0A482VPK1_ASBVE|nr:hypothetical protein BDFB_007349 [Asbolus verrucosus]